MPIPWTLSIHVIVNEFRELTMMMRQKIRRPVDPIAGLEEIRAQQSVAMIMMANSTPYIRRRPKPLGVVST
jgi:hypothetical protein